MKVFSLIKNKFLFFLLFLNIGLVLTQINDNFTSGILEEGNYDLLDITDYHNMNLIVSTSKKIYTGIPPALKVETNANLISVSSLITINQNYLLAACLQDSFLGKINLLTGDFQSLVSYSDVDSSRTLEIPQAICSLSNIEDIIFIGYSEIKQESDGKKSYNTIYKITIKNKNFIDDGPSLDDTIEIERKDIEAAIDVVSSSLRQISCEPLNIVDNPNDYNLICLYEEISTFIIDSSKTIISSDVFGFTINPAFDDFEVSIKEFTVDSGDRALGFRIYRENSTYAKCVTGMSMKEIYLDASAQILETSFSSSLYNLNADVDLLSYNNQFKFIFSASQTSFMGKNNIYMFQINQKFYKNYLKLYNYQETAIKKIFGFYIEDNNKIIFLYQTDNGIKYFTIDNNIDMYSLESNSHTIELGSYQETQYDLNELVTTPTLSELGYLNVEYIEYVTEIGEDGDTYDNDYLGIEFNELLMSNNVLIPEPSLNLWKTYFLSFIDHKENEYTRIFHLETLTVVIHTCERNCYSCWDGFNTCTDCTNSDYAYAEDSPDGCFLKTYPVEGLIYNSSHNMFLLCYSSCKFCTDASSDATDQKCSSCSSGYLYSYTNLGNCYRYTGLKITSDKEVDLNQELFISSTCSNYKIASTGECVDACPLTTPYYTYEYGQTPPDYEQVFFNPPKYLYNNLCLESCPDNSTPDENYVCKCNNCFYKDSNGNTVCLSNNNCPNDYPHLNQDTKECFSSLENCNFFSGDICYNNCPSGKVQLISQDTDIKNYIKEKLSLTDDLVDKFCMCDTTNGVWSNIDSNIDYYQECLSFCPTGYEPEEITKQCVVKVDPSTIIINNPTTNLINNVESTSVINIKTTNQIQYPSTEKVNSSTELINEISTYITNNANIDPIPPPPPIPPEPEPNPRCLVKFENRCYPECPQGTCLTQQDPELKTCIRESTNMQVFNGICFENFAELTDNIKSLSESGEIISTESGVIIRGYSTKSDNQNQEEKDSNYSLVYLGDCEYKIKTYYNLQNDTELFILGIDSPNKDITSSTSVYNYGVYLENGTLLDHNEACKDTKIAISSPITNPELVKLDEAIYFNDLGYDIFDEESSFYKDQCSSASIDGNDIILSDRKKDFYPAEVSLCNDSCIYSQVDLNSKRFTCECDLSYNYSAKVKDEKEDVENTEDDSSYIDYFLSLINYKIIKCYRLFLDYKSYYYNAGFYIAVGTLVFCLIQVCIFVKCGLRSMDIIILENVPNHSKLLEKIKEQQKEKRNANNPPKKEKNETEIIIEKQKSKSRKTVQFNLKNELKNKRKSKLKDKTQKKTKKHQSTINVTQPHLMRVIDSDDKLNFQKKNIITVNDNKSNYYNLSNETIVNNNELTTEEKVDNKDLNIIPFSQALRMDKRNCFQIFLSVLSHEIKIISIFYYRHPYEHLSIILSHYMFELCLDLTLNSLLYTEDVISEKYNNNGSIRFFTSLSLSFISNIISSIIAFFLSKLSDYAEFLDLIIKDVMEKSKYYLNIIKFKKLLCIKLTAFFFIQSLINLAMCYYLMIFCTVYHNTQGSIMINYLTGVAESMIISFALTLITSIMRTIGLKCGVKSIYYTSKYFFENF